MNLLKEIFIRNKSLAWVGAFFLFISILFILCIPFNKVEVLGINSLIKPLKFSISIWIYFWTFAYLLHYLNNKKTVKNFIYLSTFVMLYEQGVITIQAIRGSLSHFNNDNAFEMLLFTLMGVFITSITLYTLYISIILKKQKDQLNKGLKEAIFIGLIIFVFSSFLGGVMGALNSHQIGGEMGEEGLLLVNWSTKYGDLRIAHFFGLHALQMIPLLGFTLIRKKINDIKIVKIIRIVGICYLVIVLMLLIQALLGIPIYKC